ncbi:lanthionine synthetase C family protein [Streptomyces sp. NPDC051162]|uniref:lanthionine synthetase C family protein n=1 Tax=Streptomyces sp. NPDC051162 TaxID=3154747 RepID=UPI003441FC01
MGEAPWAPVLHGVTADAALGLVTALAGKPRPVPRRVRPDLAAGGPGLALAYGQLDRCLPGQGWGAMADGYLRAAAAGARHPGPASPGLFGGLGGLAFTAWSLAPGTHPLPEVHDEVLRSAAARSLGAAPHGVPVRAFDTVSGVTGTGAYLLCRHHEPASRTALRTVLAGLVTLSGERDGTPHWHTPAEHIDDPSRRSLFPSGVLNCGMAHGISGPLALLASAGTAGVTVPGQRAAVRRMTAWLTARRVEDGHGPDWPSRVAPDGRPATAGRAPATWCYGTPGIARALWLAGAALDDGSLNDLAVRTLRAAHRRLAARPDAEGAVGLCHGAAGLLHVTARFVRDTGDAELSRAAVRVAERLLACRAAVAAAGPGFLDGAAGVVLALLAAATDVAPLWDRALLLS